jgi:hypothetical protein
LENDANFFKDLKGMLRNFFRFLSFVYVVACGTKGDQDENGSLWSQYSRWSHLWDHRSFLVQTIRKKPETCFQELLLQVKRDQPLNWKSLSFDHDPIFLVKFDNVLNQNQFVKIYRRFLDSSLIQLIEPDLENELFYENPSIDSTRSSFESLRQIRWGQALKLVLDEARPILHRPVVAVFDTGVDVLHPEFQAFDEDDFDRPYHEIRNGKKVFLGFNGAKSTSLNPSTNLEDFSESGGPSKACPPFDPFASRIKDCGHGTHVAGLVAARLQGDPTITGVCPFCVVFPVRLTETQRNNRNRIPENSAILDSAVIKSLQFVRNFRQNGRPVIDLINMSFGKYSDSKILHSELKKTASVGIGLLAASGNSDTFLPAYPAAYPVVYSVGASQFFNEKEQRKAPFSNYGDIDLMAPGVRLRSLAPGGGGRVLSGTSQASPIVAGVIGFLMAVEGLKFSEALERLLKHSNAGIVYEKSSQFYRVDQHNRGVWHFGYGFLDLYAALTQEGKSEVYEEIFLQNKELLTGSYDGCIMKMTEEDPNSLRLSLHGVFNIYSIGLILFNLFRFFFKKTFDF